MIKQFFKNKKRKAIFLCQITENSLKVIKCLVSDNSKREFVGSAVEAITSDIDDKKLTEKLNQIFNKLEYEHNPVIVSLPRQKVTCRYLKVPTQAPKEIDNIVILQAPRYLPYPANELITGYQVISTEKGGYTNINLVIVHKDVVQRYLDILRNINIKDAAISLSSYGLCNLYSYMEPGEPQTVMLIDIDPPEIELLITSGGKFLFSRSFKIRGQQDWQSLLVEEINKSQDAYLKEIGGKAPGKIIIFGPSAKSQEFKEALSKQVSIGTKTPPYWEGVSASEGFLNSIANINNSLANLIGMGLKDVPNSLNLLPRVIKEEHKKIILQRERLRLISFISGIILIFGLGMAKNLDNKSKYLVRLKAELNKIENEAKSLEGIEKRFKLLEERSDKKSSGLEIFYQLHQITPNQISLANFIYEEDNQVALRGQTAELNSVFEFVSQLEKAAAFKNFNIKVRYATKKQTQSGEIIDFEIVCLKK